MRLCNKNFPLLFAAVVVLRSSSSLVQVSGFTTQHATSSSSSSSITSPTSSSSPTTSSITRLYMAPPNPSSLKPAAIPLMDSGKALARSGELLIDLTTTLEIYGGSLSAAGAQIRNSGDCVAQAAASCRFKTGRELVIDELREGATCLLEATDKLRSAVKEAETDENTQLASAITNMIDDLSKAGTTLESAGELLMKYQPLTEIGASLEQCGLSLQEFAVKIPVLGDSQQHDGVVSGQRMEYAATKMIESGLALQQTQNTSKPKPKGKGWIKG